MGRHLCFGDLFLAVLILSKFHWIVATPKSSLNWKKFDTSTIFTPRNAHASCVFRGELWVVGGRVNMYTTYDLLDSYKVADVWHSDDGHEWKQQTKLTGDFFAQNIDVVQPGIIAPWFQRYGHSLDAVSYPAPDVYAINETTGNIYSIPQKYNLMIMLGGFASAPSNDMWVTEDGNNWLYAGLAPWSARAWHFTTVFQGKLHLMGGTPLNNEVWRLENVTYVNRSTSKVHPIPLTRSLYSEYTYHLTWTRLEDAPWSPRVGAGLTSQYYFNTSNGETKLDSRQRMVMAGGYGGWLDNQTFTLEPVSQYATMNGVYDGFSCRADSWHTYDGVNWVLLNSNNTFQGRAWFGMANQQEENLIDDPYTTNEPPKMYIFGGGYIGFSTSNIKAVTSMIGKADAYWSRDGAHWNKINYEEGGGKSVMPFFSSQEWTSTIVDTNTKYIGNWGLTVESFNNNTGTEYPGEFVLIAGSFTGTGDFTNGVYLSQPGLRCDSHGVVCGGVGTCTPEGCVCPKTGLAIDDLQCYIPGNDQIITDDNGSGRSSARSVLVTVVMLLSSSLWLLM